MRLWSMHPQYLDPAGLVAVWREGLLAQAVLAGRTSGYTKHPQLIRFREHARPLAAIASYLHEVAAEARRRGYRFDVSKLPPRRKTRPIELTRAQLRFEWERLMTKMQARNGHWYALAAGVREPLPHPSFVVVEGPLAHWERAGQEQER
ncbi:MAG TPA: pyrimidine dimer DNA glycosylase/endonuclease V [Thermoanaerobaculia bacterium]|nr:pyrimidine dimer DNA glycosylase/endonuclease V [Thermoanaerobaculia bacterium]